MEGPLPLPLSDAIVNRSDARSSARHGSLPRFATKRWAIRSSPWGKSAW